MIRAIPLTILPLVAFNLVGYSLSGADPWAGELFSVTMLSGANWSMSLGDLLVVFAILMLFFEVARAAGATRRTVLNHMISTIVLIVYVVEFIAVGVAAHSVFFILTVVALFDVIAGFWITVGAARRDIALDRHVGDAL